MGLHILISSFLPPDFPKDGAEDHFSDNLRKFKTLLSIATLSSHGALIYRMPGTKCFRLFHNSILKSEHSNYITFFFLLAGGGDHKYQIICIEM